MLVNKAAEKYPKYLSKSVIKYAQKDINNMIEQLRLGNRNPGIGTKTLFKNVKEALFLHLEKLMIIMLLNITIGI